MTKRNARIGLAIALVLTLVGGLAVTLRSVGQADRVHVVAYFANSDGIYAGDEVRILGVPVGRIDRIEPQPHRAKITFWYDGSYQVPADAKAAILSPSLVAVRAIQLTPAYTGGPVLRDNSVIGQERTAVPVEWDDFRQQLQKLTDTLQPTQPGGVSTLGAFVNTAADNLRGQGANIRDTLVKLSQAFSALGDHSKDIFSTVKNVSTLVSALQDSGQLMRQLNQNLAAVTALLSNDPNEVGNVLSDMSAVIGDVTSFLANNRESLGATADKLASVTTALNQSLDDLKQTLHVAPTAIQNFVNIYQPAQGTLSGVLAVNNFANPIQFLCSAVQAASRLGAEQASKLCVQYLAPIIKNRQYNFPPLGENAIVGASARPNELTYSEDWLRPDYVPPPAAQPPQAVAPQTDSSPLPAEARPTEPAAGLQGIMVPSGGGS
ncbi:virulence factor Mce family protein [Mycobacterium sp. CVI_P3]|uniref:Virulence factor Mce family protein n=1 Tax=Mycobacterium pinniadriaticum TaxID=2994102 RepID=A0ABT3SMQ9_9MYCO|nr:virulence factor Mce family protein [Mycobacterium pinniadriaticum]MCX2933680.1 virulence factor Mce family protein [Mycobacterium pinniadriaticum]MCX2940102.1 virulence factor Mce family protein [Mycobacterium pinniadriaticum]